MAEPIVQTSNLSKSYYRGEQTIQALWHVSMAVAPGEMVSIIGPSGCGKSTLLMLLGGLDKPTAGSVKLKGTDLGAVLTERLVALRRKTVGFVFQSDNLLPTLTLLENVALPMGLAGHSPANYRSRAIHLLASVGLAEKLDALPGEVSGGQRQRASIARALANDPELVLADEPTGNLDSATARAVIDLLVNTLHERRAALVMVTHDQKVAARTDRLLRLRDGRFNG
jgi:putative ABC transport system ATP-binding protein